MDFYLTEIYSSFGDFKFTKFQKATITITWTSIWLEETLRLLTNLKTDDLKTVNQAFGIKFRMKTSKNKS